MDTKQWQKQMGDVSQPILDRWLAKAGDAELFRVNTKELAPKLDISHPELLTIFLKAVERGTFQMNWEFHCPHCNAIPGSKHKFHELQAEGFCGLCDVKFRNTLDANVEVTFTVHPSLHKIKPKFVENYTQGMIAAVKSGGVPRAPVYLSGLECLNNPLYHELFGDEVLSSEESLEISKVTLLFTDIKGSTEMYTRLGDTASYRIVREHFKVLFKEVEANGGVVVKTIGDAVMASFVRPEDGVRAALSAYDLFKQREWDTVGKLEIKMGLHTGGVIVVNLNNQVDYFGNTVNKSARIQSVAENHTVCFTNEILESPEVKQQLKVWMGANAGKVLKKTVRLKGIDGPVDFYRIEN